MTNSQRMIALLLVAVGLVMFAPTAATAAIGAVSSFGEFGTEGGQFNSPSGIAINETGVGGVDPGSIYVADRSNNRIEQFTSGGQFVRAFGSGVGGAGIDLCASGGACGPGVASGVAAGMVRPEIITVDQATGAVFVADGKQARIDVFSALGEFEGAWGWNVDQGAGSEGLQFCTRGTGCTAGTAGSAAGQIGPESEAPLTGIDVSPINGDVLVMDAGNRRVDDFSPTTNGSVVTGVSFVRGFGWGAASGADEFQNCTTTCASPGPEGQSVGQFVSGAASNRTTGLGVGPTGTIYTSELGNALGNNRVQSFGADGHVLGVVAGDLSAVKLAVDHVTGNLWVAKECAADFTAPLGCVNPDVGTETRIEVFSPAGEHLETFFPGIGLARLGGVAVDGVTGDAYVASGNEIVALGEVVPPAVSIEPVTQISGTSAHFEGSVNPKGLRTTYTFEYTSSGTSWSAIPSGELPASNSNQTVAVDATGLEAHTQYTVKLVAVKHFGAGSAEATTTFETGASIPVITGTRASAVNNESAVLQGAVNPEQESTAYQFECVSQAQYEYDGFASAVVLPPGGKQLASARSPFEVEEPLTGLLPETFYRCRISATNGSGVAAGEEIVFKTFAGPAAGLPDGRVYEQATPLDKNGSDVQGVEGLLKAASGGEAVTYFITGGGAVGEGSQEFPVYNAHRSANGWSSFGFFPPASVGSMAYVIGWSEDLERSYILTRNPGELFSLYAKDNTDGTLTKIASGIGLQALNQGFGSIYAGESRDGNEVLFEIPDVLVPGAAGNERRNLYIWNRQSNTLTLASITPDESPAVGGAFAGPWDWALQNPMAGGSVDSYYTQARHVISESGSTVFFTTANVNQIYVRSGLDGPAPVTKQVSLSQKTNGSGPGGRDPSGTKKATFMEATPEGTFVFFTSPEELTNDATTGTGDSGNDLYRYDVASGELIDIAPDTVDPSGAEVQSVLGASADGSYVYFAANGVLAPGASKGNCANNPKVGAQTGSPASCNIYLWHEGVSSFVSSVNGQGGFGTVDVWQPVAHFGANVPPMLRTRVSQDGQALLFSSADSPTAYNSDGTQQFYRYQVGAGLTCISCSPTGAAPEGEATMQSIPRQFTTPAGPQPFLIRNVSSDGDRIFFETSAKLVADDTNGVQDVYEWEADGTGSCGSALQNGGCLYLISTGSGSSPAYFDDASADGSNVFFLTRDRLVAQDKDSLVDVYDARVGGGIGIQQQAPEALCEGEECLGAPGVLPSAQLPGSSSFAGPGNPKPKRVCRKRTHAVIKKGKRTCVPNKARGKKHKPKREGHSQKKHHRKARKQGGAAK